VRALFVDPERAMLSSIGRLLRGSLDPLDELDLEVDPERARQLLSDRQYDLVVTELRLEKLSGELLLKETKRHSPQAVRVILTGYEEKDTALGALDCAHIFMRKPFAREEVESLMQRARALLSIPLESGLRHALGRLKALPPMPSYMKLLEDVLSDDNSTASVADIASLIQHDLGLVGNILHTVNSAYYGLSQPVIDVGRAVSILGTEMLRAVVLKQSLLQQAKAWDIDQEWLQGLYLYSENVSSLSLNIARHQGLDRRTREICYIAGLLHDVGRLLLAMQLPGEERKGYFPLSGENLCRQERKIFGVEHGWVGAYLLELWGFPKEVVNAVASHHQPARLEGDGLSPVSVVHASSALLENPSEPWLDREYLEAVGCSDETLAEWRLYMS
jgi:putative nucleotidyltransferase with HDIG domain